MNSIPTRTIQKSLKEKGFQETEGTKHTLYHFWNNGKVQDISTKVSRGSGYKDYSIDLIKEMKWQLKFETLSQTFNFLKCPMSHEQYLHYLNGKGLISS